MDSDGEVRRGTEVRPNVGLRRDFAQYSGFRDVGSRESGNVGAGGSKASRPLQAMPLFCCFVLCFTFRSFYRAFVRSIVRLFVRVSELVSELVS